MKSLRPRFAAMQGLLLGSSAVLLLVTAGVAQVPARAEQRMGPNKYVSVPLHIIRQRDTGGSNCPTTASDPLIVGMPTHQPCRVAALPTETYTPMQRSIQPKESQEMGKASRAAMVTSAAAGLLAGVPVASQAGAVRQVIPYDSTMTPKESLDSLVIAKGRGAILVIMQFDNWRHIGLVPKQQIKANNKVEFWGLVTQYPMLDSLQFIVVDGDNGNELYNSDKGRGACFWKFYGPNTVSDTTTPFGRRNRKTAHRDDKLHYRIVPHFIAKDRMNATEHRCGIIKRNATPQRYVCVDESRHGYADDLS